MSMFADTHGYADYADSAHKLLSDNRDFYVAMSRMTVNGRVPTADEVRAEFPARFPSAQPAPAGLSEAGTCNTSALPGAAGGAEKGRVERPFPDCGNPSRRGLNPGNYNPDPPTPDEVAEAYRFKYGA